MEKNVIKFKELLPEQQAFAGGKGSMLSKMFQSGYPVPDGFVILPTAFQDEYLNGEAWKQIQLLLNDIRKSNADAKFAIRSSAFSEDNAQASFAGEFESVLNIEADKDIHEAIYTVFKSRESERVKSYSSVKGMEIMHQIAIVVQLMVQSEISGVLFTSDPITGSYTSMIGNYVYGLGEQLVSGESNAFDFKINRPKGKYEGPDDFKKYALKLFKYASNLENEFGNPQDIEWTVSKGRLYILQARPITTLSFGDLDTYEINYSMMSDELWINTNVAEAIPDVFSPFNWSIESRLDEALDFIPGYYVLSGNICGRPYMNISKRVSVISSMLGKDARSSLKLLGDFYGDIPEEMSIPIYPYARFEVIKNILPKIIKTAKKSTKDFKTLDQFLKLTPEWCKNVRKRIKDAVTKEELLSLWKNEIQPYLIEAWSSASAGAIKITNVTTLDKELIKLVGTEDANTLLSNLRGDEELASLGPVAGISKIINGELSRNEYLNKYGHRGAHEYELSIPDPMEDDNWLDKQIEEFKKSNINVDELLDKQRIKFESAKSRFEKQYPNKIKWLNKKLEKASEGANLREEARSEFVRVFRVVRAFALRAGEFLDLGDGVFFLYINEIEQLLSGEKLKINNIAARKENYEKYKTLPPLPSIIRGRFNPYEWLKDPNRRMDYYDASMPAVKSNDSEVLKGCAGAAGRIEGIVRILSNPEEGDKLLHGEILVASTTNIGWTPIFPKAAAIITDIGAPLSHAAIVAREMGIPAVVGCGNATLRLKTGDRVIVDGGNGIVEILKD
jgi:pyruvate,water dikinase